MKRIDSLKDVVMKDYNVKNKEEAVKYYCPKYLKCEGDMVDYTTTFSDETGQNIGCRGIACIECWNKEVEQ